MKPQQWQDQQAGAVAILGPQYCVPHSTKYVIKKEYFSISGGDYSVKDTHGNLVFKVEGRAFNMRQKRVLLDASGIPLMCMNRKMYSLHEKWRAFLGDSTSSRQRLFTLARSSVYQFKTSLNVFLAHNNNNNRVPDFTIKGNSRARDCLIYHHNQAIAQVKRRRVVHVYPGIDSAFIISLVVILDELQKNHSMSNNAS